MKVPIQFKKYLLKWNKLVVGVFLIGCVVMYIAFGRTIHNVKYYDYKATKAAIPRHRSSVR